MDTRTIWKRRIVGVLGAALMSIAITLLMPILDRPCSKEDGRG